MFISHFNFLNVLIDAETQGITSAITLHHLVGHKFYNKCSIKSQIVRRIEDYCRYLQNATCFEANLFNTLLIMNECSCAIQYRCGRKHG